MKLKNLDSVKNLIQKIQSGHRVFIQGGAGTPNVLIDELVAQANRLKDVELIHLHTIGPARYAEPSFKQNFRVANLFVGENLRSSVDYDQVDYLPCFLSEIPQLFRSKRRPLNVSLVHLSPPDDHGYCTLGTSVDVTKAAIENSDLVLAQINQQMPRVHGDGFVHINDIDGFVEVDVPIPESKTRSLRPEEIAIGSHAAKIIEDGATLQVGIGTIPDAIVAALSSHKNLGIHSELWSDGVLSLIKKGVVDNSKKTVHPGKTVSGFVVGSRALYDFIHDNPSVIQLGIDYVNNPLIIARNPRVTAINSAVEIDLSGQVCADSLGSRIISGVGGQMDFIRGASLSQGGKPIIAITSQTGKGISRIVSHLKPGAGVVTTRAHVHYVISEYGTADLYGKTLRERAQEMIRIAHPRHRENLEREWSSIQNRGFTPRF